ncbi:MAG: hypothetical protein ACR2KV_13480 [Solirubrobacteraceae bacterium]
MTENLLDRVAAANPVIEVQTPERDLDLLLESVLRRGPFPGRARSTSRRRMGIPAVIAAAIVAVLLTAIDHRETPSAAASAYAAAAVKPMTILHAVYSTRTVRADGRVLEAEQVEAWIAADARVHTVRTRRLPADVAGRYESALARGYAMERQPSGKVKRVRMDRRAARLNAEASNPGAVFAKLYRRGAVREHGREVVEGRTLISFSMQNGDAQMTYLVDPRTYLPVIIRVVTGGAGGGRERTVSTTRVTTFDRLPDNAHNERLLTLNSAP